MMSMNTYGALGTTTALLILVFVFIGAVATSEIINTTSEELSEDDINQMLEDTITEISTYISIDNIVGKYATINEEQRIKQIAFMIQPMFDTEIELASLPIQLSNGFTVQFLNHGNVSGAIGSYSLFQHPLWNSLQNTTFGLISILDQDNSILNHGIINDHSDMAYIIIDLPDDLTMKKGETLTISLFPASGITRSFTIKAPLPMKPVVTFE